MLREGKKKRKSLDESGWFGHVRSWLWGHVWAHTGLWVTSGIYALIARIWPEWHKEQRRKAAGWWGVMSDGRWHKIAGPEVSGKDFRAGNYEPLYEDKR